MNYILKSEWIKLNTWVSYNVVVEFFNLKVINYNIKKLKMISNIYDLF